MSEQIAVRLPDELASGLQALVEDGTFETKAEAIRSAIETMIDTERRRRTGEEIADGYRRMPQSEDDDLADLALAAARQTLQALEAEEREVGLEW
jgi:Arc/MetJ-type ribon-helix-helix transcriptional regulator